jgi:hypothetical protein
LGSSDHQAIENAGKMSLDSSETGSGGEGIRRRGGQRMGESRDGEREREREKRERDKEYKFKEQGRGGGGGGQKTGASFNYLHLVHSGRVGDFDSMIIAKGDLP